MKKREKMDTLGQRIKEARKQAGISLRELAARTGMEYTYLSKIQNDHYMPSIRALDRIAHALGIPFGELAVFKIRGKESYVVTIADMKGYRAFAEDAGEIAAFSGGKLVGGYLTKPLAQAIGKVYHLSPNEVRTVARMIGLLSEYEPDGRKKRLKAVTALLEPLGREGEKGSHRSRPSSRKKPVRTKKGRRKRK
jgi:transcriptional regulator with XRE-family HTH domain